MDDVSAWLAEEGAYQVGLHLYLQHPYHNRNIARTLGIRENFRNRAKLEYEVKKIYSQRPLSSQEDKERSQAPTKVIHAGKPTEKVLQEEAIKSYQGSIRLSDLHPSLHPKFIKQKDTYYKIWMLHYQLEDIDDDAKRLDALREIMAGWDFINAVWREIDYWMKTRELADDAGLLELETLSPEKLAARKLSIRSNISRYIKKIESLEAKHAETADTKLKGKLLGQLSKAKKTLERNELRIARINQLMNE